MVPRGEVGLIFASVGRALGVVDTMEYSVIVVVIMLTTFVTPPILGSMVKKISHS
jgi:Kef-type K+ transport system membrane component KefB